MGFSFARFRQPYQISFLFATQPFLAPSVAHTRLAWTERLVRNARAPSAMQVRITLFRVPNPCATSLGLAIA
jgi:hypothetical protein